MNSTMIKLKPLIISLAIPLILGFIGSLLSGNFNDYAVMNKPSFSPPAILFPIVWTILYILMGVSSYLIYTSAADEKEKNSALSIYLIQLILNSLWTLIFFRFSLYLFAFLWIILIIIAVVIMIYKFIKIKPLAGYLQIPYLLWLIFASILNYNIYLLN